MPARRLFLLCSLSAALLAPGAFAGARHKAGPARVSPRVKRAVKSMSRAVEGVKVIMREVRRRHREAVAVATREGVHTP